MSIKNWFKLTFQVSTDLEEIIVWKLNDLGINSYALENLLNNQDEIKVIVWLPISDWKEIARIKFEIDILELMDRNNYPPCLFSWSNIDHEDWMESWKRFWSPESIGNNLVILPC